MPTAGDEPDILLDTSAAVALVVADHGLHGVTVEALAGRMLGLSGHSVFETFSVLTRLPPPARRSPAVVARLIAVNFPASRFLSSDAAEQLVARLHDGEIAGGSVYDALVGAAAIEHRTALATHDRRALETYRVLAVDVELLPAS